MELLEQISAFLVGLPVSLQVVLATLLGVVSLLYKSKILRWPLVIRWPFALTYTVLTGVTRVMGWVLNGRLVEKQWLLYDAGPKGPIPLRVKQGLPAGAVRRLASWEVEQYAQQGSMPRHRVDSWEVNAINNENLGLTSSLLISKKIRLIKFARINVLKIFYINPQTFNTI